MKLLKLCNYSAPFGANFVLGVRLHINTVKLASMSLTSSTKIYARYYELQCKKRLKIHFYLDMVFQTNRIMQFIYKQRIILSIQAT